MAKPHVTNCLQLAGLASLALARPYFEPLSGDQNFFIERGATGADVVLFALAFVLVPWLALFAVDALSGWRLHLPIVAGLVALIAWQAGLPYVPAAFAGGAGALALWRFEPAGTFLVVLGAAAPVVLALFLTSGSVRPLAFGGAGPAAQNVRANRTPLVMVVLDEMPTASLIDARGRLDARRLPGFAALARDATWYRNATTVSDFTQLAVPAILTGNRPRAGALQVVSKYPRNLFTLLGASRRLDVFEATTDLCARACTRQLREPQGARMRKLIGATVEQIPALPPRVRTRLGRAIAPDGPPAGAARLTRVGDQSVRRFLATTQDVRFARFLDSLAPTRGRPALNFQHLALPHHPWRYLPSGRRYSSPRAAGLPMVGIQPRDPNAVAVSWQRHLLQVQALDALIEKLRRRMIGLGTWDRSLVVITADHGMSFTPGRHSRQISRVTAGQIAPVPMFVKAPGQRTGRVDDSPVATIDLLPTIARTLGVRLPWKVDGADVSAVPARRALAVLREQDGRELTLDRRSVLAARDRAARRRARTFARGMFLLGPPGPARRDARARVRLDRRASDSVDVSGTISAPGPPRTRPIAVRVNGRLVASGWSIRGRGGEEFFTSLLPPRSLPGRIEVIALRNRGR